jgi:anaerobic ribonucleoside-triphosphate reductase
MSVPPTTLQPDFVACGEVVELADEERQPCEVWTRVMGYHRPVASFNTGKQGEHRERRFFAERA